MRRIHRTRQRHRKNFSEGIVNRAIAAAHTGHAKLIEADAYLFDIDGTLFNSRDGVHYQAFCRTLAEVYGVEPSLDGLPVHGNTDIGILRAAVARAGKSASFERLLPRALELLQSEFAAGAGQFLPQLCPFIGELIQHLHDRGKILGVASGNLTTVGWAKITAAGLRAYFSFGAFCDGCEARADIVRAAIAQARKIAASAGPAATVCLVGDTPADIAAARANAIPVIAVATGTFSFAELLAGQPDLCLNSCADLRL